MISPECPVSPGWGKNGVVSISGFRFPAYDSRFPLHAVQILSDLHPGADLDLASVGFAGIDLENVFDR